MTPPRQRAYFRRILESIRLAVHGRARNDRDHNASSRVGVIDSHSDRHAPQTTSARLRQFFFILRGHNVLSLPLVFVVVAVLICHQSFGLSGPPRLIVGARGCALGMLMCALIMYLLAIVQALRNDTD